MENTNININKSKLVHVGKDMYLIFSPLNKEKHLLPNNQNNPYKMLLKNYNNSIEKNINRRFPNKETFLWQHSADLSKQGAKFNNW